MSDEKPMGQVIQIDEARIRDHLGEMVRGTVEETLNAMLDAEADQLCGAGRYDAAKLGRIHGLAATSERCRPVPAKLASRFRSCGARPSRRRSSNVAAGGRAQSGSADRDVSGGDFGSAGRGHHRGPLGHAGKPKHGLEPQQEDLRQDRGLAEPADRR
jgi:hypothetical protein